MTLTLRTHIHQGDHPDPDPNPNPNPNPNNQVILGCSVASIGWAVGSDALGLDAGLRFTFTYLLAGIPIGILAIGSVTLTLASTLALTR